MAIKISNKTLLEDIKNTQREKEAYNQLADGYLTLSKLPENQENGATNLYLAHHRNNTALAIQCGKLLEQLLALKALREL
ncbi:MAG: hypothetical protein ABSG01_09085 [Anaerolineales bacterium]